MPDRPRLKKDFLAGGLLVLIGSGAAVEGATYAVGTLTHMGPGFMPVSLGVILTLLGIVIAGSAATGEGEHEPIFQRKPEWLAWACILAGPLLFIVLGTHVGLIPAAFACVFVSGLADRTATLKSAFVLAAAVTLVGAVLFGYLLQIQLPLLRWS